MPCPFFEPTSIAADPHAPHVRLPLIAEHDGLCNAGTIPIAAPTEHRFAGCNHGRAQERCPRFPANGTQAIRRFTVQAQADSILTVLVSEEIDHFPVRWRQVRYSQTSEELRTTDLPVAPNAAAAPLSSGAASGGLCASGKVLDPPPDRCELAQVRAFCSTYLQRCS